MNELTPIFTSPVPMQKLRVVTVCNDRNLAKLEAMLYAESEVRQSSKGEGWIVVCPQRVLDELNIAIVNDLDSHL